MDERILFEETLGVGKSFREIPVYENQTPLDSPATPDISRKVDQFYNNARALLKSTEDVSGDLVSHSDIDCSFFNNRKFEGLSPGYGCLPSVSKLKKFKKVVTEVNDKYLDWMISELVLRKYRTSCYEMPPQIANKVKDIITSSKVQPLSIMKNRRGESLNLLGLEEDDFATISKKSLLSSEKKELSNKMMMALKITIKKLSEERDKLKGMFSIHCLKVTPVDTVLSEEQVQQAQVNDQMRLRLDQGCESLIAANQMMRQLAHLEVDSVRQLQNVSYSSLTVKARHLTNNLSILKHKMDQIALADVNYTRSMNIVGDRLKTSVDSLSEKRKSLLKALEKYERKENVSKTFNEIVAEYAKTKRQLHHKLQTLNVLNEPDASFS